jgi:hypothetical protein
MSHDAGCCPRSTRQTVIHLLRDTVEWDRTATAEARAHFDAHHWLKLPRFLSGPLLTQVQDAVRLSQFVEVIHQGVSPPSIDVCMEPNPTSALLELLCNDAALFTAVESVTGCAPLRRFSGFVYRLAPDTGHHHNWHNDMIQGRRVALTVNVEQEPYEGGVLQIRLRDSGQVIEEVANVSPGDAVLFRIDAKLQHRATAVTSGVKTAFAGWFRSSPSLREELAQLASSRAS